MKISLLILLLAMLSAAVCSVLLIIRISNWFKIWKLNKNTIGFNENQEEKVNDSLISWILRNGVSFLIKPSNYLLSHIKVLDELFENILSVLEDKKITTSKNSVLSVVIFFSVITAILFMLIFGSPIAGIAVILLIWICLITSIRVSLDKKSSALRNSIPETLRSMSSCFGAGYTLYQTFNQICSETKGGIHKLFAKSSHVLQTGGSVSQSLETLKNAKAAPELAFVAVALDVQHQTGGSMKPVIESAKDMVESKLELLRMLQVQTAQAKLSARIVIILPFALIAIFSIISPGFLNPFFSSFLGVIILGLAIVMQTAGTILVKKMLYVEL